MGFKATMITAIVSLLLSTTIFAAEITATQDDLLDSDILNLYSELEALDMSDLDGIDPDINDSTLIDDTSLDTIKDLIAIDPSDKANYQDAAKIMAQNNISGIKIFVDGALIDFAKYNNVEPVIENDRTLLPIRAISEALSANVNFDDTIKLVTVTLGNKNLKLTLGSKDAYVNGVKTILDVPAKAISGRTLVPLRFISENFNKKVEFIPYSNQLKIIYIY